MCNLETEGTRYACGHYVITKKLRKIDCGNPCCTYSVKHARPCRDCDYHEKFLGPDANETVTRVCLEFCDECHRWYNRR